jgi:hypothetical protein
MVPAMGTIPVSTGMRNVDLIRTIVIGASYKHVWTILLPASFHSLQGFSMPRQNHIFILPKKTVFEFVDDGSKKDHFAPSQRISRPLTKVLIA